MNWPPPPRTTKPCATPRPSLSIRDALTGLVSRRSLIQQRQHAVATCDRHQGECALPLLRPDRFKQVNDDLGHHAGDELLRQVAARRWSWTYIQTNNWPLCIASVAPGIMAIFAVARWRRRRCWRCLNKLPTTIH